VVIKYSRNFNKSFFRRIKSDAKLVKRTQERITLFLINPENETIKNHRLVGNKVGLYSFSINGDFRIVYRRVNSEVVEFIDIGTHNQVYGK